MRFLVVAMALGFAAACEVPDPPPGDGGIEDDGDVCGPGLVVISSDYQSTSVAFVRWDGDVAAHRVISSASEEAGLSASLSGDVVAPTMESGTTEMVLVDRYPASVLTWVRTEDGVPARQLSINSGFLANAQDWISVDETRGYASRYQANPDPGREPFDGGSDVLVVDPRTPAVVGRIGFEGVLDGEDAGLVPSPGRMVLAGDRLVVLLSVYSADFERSGEGRVAIIDTTTDAVVAVHRVPGLRGCSALSLDPSGERVAVGCSGTFGGDATPTLEDAGIAEIALADGAVTARVAAADALGRPPGFSVAYASPRALLVPTTGHLASDGGDAVQDVVFLVPLDGGAPSSLLEGVEPFSIGEVRCAVACGACFVADGGRDLLQRVAVDGGAATLAATVAIDDGGRLVPRYLGALPRAPGGAAEAGGGTRGDGP